MLGFAGLVAIAPPLSEPLPLHRSAAAAPSGEGFRYLPDGEVYALDFDPRQVSIDLFTGWDREQEAYADRSALAFVSGPMYERYAAADGGATAPGAGSEPQPTPAGGSGTAAAPLALP